MVDKLKAPKAYWNNPGLAVFLSGYFQVAGLRAARECSAYFETLVFHHLRVLTRLMTPPGRLYFWRTQTGVEVDFILEHGRRVLAIEAKLTHQPTYSDAAGLRRFLAEHPKTAGGLLLHSGQEIRRLDENILAVPWTLVTG